MLDMMGDPTLLIEAYSRTGWVRVVLPAALTVLVHSLRMRLMKHTVLFSLSFSTYLFQEQKQCYRHDAGGPQLKYT